MSVTSLTQTNQRAVVQRNKQLAVRRRGTREQDVMPFEDFLAMVRELRATRSLALER